MVKVCAAINVTVDGVFDHTSVTPDSQVHDHYTQLLQNSDVILFGRKTFQLMKFWQGILNEPSDEKAINDFAETINNIDKIVFTSTLTSTEWENAKITTLRLKDQIELLKSQGYKSILLGSRSLIYQGLEQNLLNELQICIHPVIAGNGQKLFDSEMRRFELVFSDIKTFLSGAVLITYKTKFKE